MSPPRRTTRNVAKHNQPHVNMSDDAQDSDGDQDDFMAAGRKRTAEVQIPAHLQYGVVSRRTVDHGSNMSDDAKPFSLDGEENNGDSDADELGEAFSGSSPRTNRIIESVTKAGTSHDGETGFSEENEQIRVEAAAAASTKQPDDDADDAAAAAAAAKQEPELEAEHQTQMQLNTSWLTRLKSCFSFTATGRPSPDHMFSGQLEFKDDETTMHTISEAIDLFEKDMNRLQSEYATRSAILARLGHDCFHVEATLPQQIVEKDTTEECLQRAADLEVADAQCKLSEAIWRRYLAANKEEITEQGEDAAPHVSELKEAYERFRRDEDKRSQAKARLQVAENRRMGASKTCCDFRGTTENLVGQAKERVERAAKRLKTAESWSSM
ncbi:hypothetical protein N0V93_010316 [Gnomoniopsis smithogilvyi]|uniref:Uncharacterized protein n=1 Tax=Gnomoniopsis smithogilvyi TaxID=1191159 RepID=A0A9W8YID5_9PEZI|nr:hypothetical protein N0V93_010316 [Gnomoniopsis smithogilvyi]